MMELLRLLLLTGAVGLVYWLALCALKVMPWGIKCLAILGCMSVLTGCATAPRVERVDVPVQVPCRVTIPEEPVYATAALAADASIWEQAKALLAERKQRIAYTTKIQAAARSCQ